MRLRLPKLVAQRGRLHALSDGLRSQLCDLLLRRSQRRGAVVGLRRRSRKLVLEGKILRLHGAQFSIGIRRRLRRGVVRLVEILLKQRVAAQSRIQFVLSVGKLSLEVRDRLVARGGIRRDRGRRSGLLRRGFCRSLKPGDLLQQVLVLRTQQVDVSLGAGLLAPHRGVLASLVLGFAQLLAKQVAVRRDRSHLSLQGSDLRLRLVELLLHGRHTRIGFGRHRRRASRLLRPQLGKLDCRGIEALHQLVALRLERGDLIRRGRRGLGCNRFGGIRRTPARASEADEQEGIEEGFQSPHDEGKAYSAFVAKQQEEIGSRDRVRRRSALTRPPRGSP